MFKLCNAILILFISIEIHSAEILFLPAILRIDPLKKQKILNVSEYSLAELSAYYADENFLIDVVGLKNQSIVHNLNYSKEILSKKCNESETDYLFLSEIEITDFTVIKSKVYNCKGRYISEEESVIKNNFYFNFEKHIKKTLRFLPEKKNQNFDFRKKEEIIFLIDPSANFLKERANLVNLLREYSNKTNYLIGIVIPSDKNLKFFPPSEGNRRILDGIENIPSEKIFLEDVKESIFRIYENLGKGDIKNKKFIIFTGAKPKKINFDFSNTIDSLSKIGYSVFIVTGSYFNNEIAEIYRKAARKSRNKLIPITHFQKIGTMNGIKTIFINDQKVFLTEGFVDNERNFNSIEKIQIPSTQIYSKFEYPSIYNMVDIYESINHTRTIEKGSILNNVRSIAEEIIQEKMSDNLGGVNKVLIKSGELSIWIFIKNFREELLGSEVTIKTEFFKDSNNSYGFSNNKNFVFVNPKLAPAMLRCSPKDIISTLKNETQNSMKCFLKGKVLEIK